MYDVSQISIDYEYIGGGSEQALDKHRQTNRLLCFCVAISVLEGTYFLKIEDETIAVTPGKTIVIPEEIRHDIWVEEKCVISYAHFSCRIMLQDVLKFAQRSCVMLSGDEALVYIDRMNHGGGEAEILGKLCRDSAIAGFMALVFQAGGIRQSVIVEEKWLFDINAYIKSNMDKAISVEELVSISGYSKTVFYKRFSHLMNTTPNAYIISQKMQFACRLLLQGKRVKEVAERVGFFDEMYFCKLFKKHIGVVPSAYKRMVEQ